MFAQRIHSPYETMPGNSKGFRVYTEKDLLKAIEKSKLL